MPLTYNASLNRLFPLVEYPANKILGGNGKY